MNGPATNKESTCSRHRLGKNDGCVSFINAMNNYLNIHKEFGKVAEIPWRLVRSPPNYYSHYHAKADAYAYERLFESGLYPIDDEAQSLAIVSCQIAGQYDYPTYYVGRDYAEAMYRSKMPEICPSDIGMPFPGLLLGFPVDFCLSVFKRHVPYIFVATIDADVYRNKGHSISIGNKCFAVSAGIIDNDDIGKSNTYYSVCPFDKPFSGLLNPDAPFNAFYSDEEPDDRKLSGLLASLSAKCLLSACARPELVEDTPVILQHRKVKKSKERPELWSPRWIGQHYKIHQDHANLGGTHASPTAHWRAGHYRVQHYGPKNQLKKVIFIDPVLVNAQ